MNKFFQSKAIGVGKSSKEMAGSEEVNVTDSVEVFKSHTEDSGDIECLVQIRDNYCMQKEIEKLSEIIDIIDVKINFIDVRLHLN